MDAGQINVTPRTENRARQNLAAHTLFSLTDHEQFDQAIIDQNLAANRHIVGKTGVIHVHEIALLAFRAGHGELQNVARLQMQAGLEIASPDSRALSIKKKCNRPARFLCEHSDAWNNFAHPFVGGVTHIYSEDVASFLY